MSSSSRMKMDSHPAHLPPSELGTKEYWESFYEASLSHLSLKRQLSTTGPKGDGSGNGNGAGGDDGGEDEYEQDSDDDPGTSWFTEHKAPEKVLRFLTSPAFPLSPHSIPSHPQSQAEENQTAGSLQPRPQQQQPSVLDLGTGNGHMLALLRSQGGFTGPMVGVDYSEKSIELARQLLPSCGLAFSPPASCKPDIRFEVWDILGRTSLSDLCENTSLDWFPYDTGGFDIVLDKGTFDAVSLSAEEVVEEDDDKALASVGVKAIGSRTVRRRVCERYPIIAEKLVRKGGFLVVTSCNWTEDELVRWFTGRGDGVCGDGDSDVDGLAVWDRIEYPKFRFGGQEGQGVCTVCFRRKGGNSWG